MTPVVHMPMRQPVGGEPLSRCRWASPGTGWLRLLALVLWIWPCGASADSDKDHAAVLDGHERLDILEAYSLPMREVSGLALAQDEGGVDIYAVGDASYDLGRLRAEGPPRSVSIQVRDVADLASAEPNAASQWEAVATDGPASVCALAETSARVTCLSADLTQIVADFGLDVASIPSLNRQWTDEPNSRGEGMVLLREGHVLLLKEKKPSLLVEFGPSGEVATGWNADAPLRAGETFAVPASGALVALKVWAFADNLAALAKDGSDLTSGPDGHLYMLSQESAVLVRLEGTLRPEEDKVHAAAAWRLPQDLDRAEGLVIDNRMHPWVAVDVHATDGPNLYRLSAIEPP
jgi:hypothetical protein